MLVVDEFFWFLFVVVDVFFRGPKEQRSSEKNASDFTIIVVEMRFDKQKRVIRVCVWGEHLSLTSDEFCTQDAFKFHLHDQLKTLIGVLNFL